MGYYIRVLGKRVADIAVDQLREFTQPAVLNISEEHGDTWAQLTLSHKSGQDIAIIERNFVVDGQLGADELREFIDEVQHYKPETAVAWLKEYLPNVRVIYAFQLLSGTEVDDGWAPLHRLYNAVWKHAEGILQADGEGFCDEDGFTILWQFSDAVSGEWNMGVLKNGRWVHFEMDLGNEQHREAFLSGQVPDGAKLA